MRSATFLQGLGAGLLAGGTGFLLWKKIGRYQGTSEQTPGSSVGMKKGMLEMGAHALQKFLPINGIHYHLAGFHFYSGDLARAVEAHHFCSHVNEDIHQCVIYDSNAPDARLIGIEYVISDKIFKQLPPEERKYWHSHAYEVKSGMLTAPHLPQAAENKLMEELAPTYGKTIHTWQYDRDPLPLGPPKLMMAFTADGQLPVDAINKRDKALGVDTMKIRKAREYIKPPAPMEGADSWTSGRAWQVTMSEVK